MKTYLNLKSQYGIETVDELSREDFPTYREYKAEVRRLIGEYNLAGMNVYPSQRATKEWRAA